MTKIKRLVTFAYVSYLTLWLFVEITVVIWLFATNNLAIFHDGSRAGITDFVVFYIAGKVAASPQRTELFNAAIYKNVFESVTHCTLSNPDMRNYFLPFVHLFMTVFANLPIDLAHLLFITVTTLFGLWSLYLLIKEMGSCNRTYACLLLLGILASGPSCRNWTQGQMTWLYIGLIGLCLRYFFKNQNLKAGVALALCGMKPQYAIYLAAPVLVIKRYRLLLFAGLTELFLLLICGQVFGFSTLATYPQSLNDTELNSLFTNALSMTCLRAFFCLFLSQSGAYKLSLLTNLAGLSIITSICFVALRRSKSVQTLYWVFSSAILASLLFSAHAHFHDCLLIAIPAVLTLPTIVSLKNLRPTLFAWKWCLYTLPISSSVSFCLLFVGIPGNLLMIFIISLLLFCSLRQILSQPT